MAGLNKISEFLDTYLDIYDIKDSCWNGLQFEGRHDVQKIIYSVDASSETFRKSSSMKGDMIIVHHGHFWKNLNPSYSGWARKRLDILKKNNISLYACHLPLDRHRIVGNNAQILNLLGAEISDEFLLQEGKNVGWIGMMEQGLQLQEIEKILNRELETKCNVLDFGNDMIKTIAVCSGGGGYGGFYEALEKGADLYVTGDTAEIYYTAKDAGINVIFAGHHCTETIGLKALSKVVEKEFGVQSQFLDLPTGL